MPVDRKLLPILVATQKYLQHRHRCPARYDWAWSEKCTCGLREVYLSIQLEKVALRPGRRPEGLGSHNAPTGQEERS